MQLPVRVPEEVIEAIECLKGAKAIDIDFENTDADEHDTLLRREKEMENFEAECLEAGIDELVSGSRVQLESSHWIDYEIKADEALKVRLSKLYALRELSMMAHTLPSFAGECLALGAFHKLDEMEEEVIIMEEELKDE
jgi:hypothetical protein